MSNMVCANLCHGEGYLGGYCKNQGFMKKKQCMCQKVCEQHSHPPWFEGDEPPPLSRISHEEPPPLFTSHEQLGTPIQQGRKMVANLS